MDNTVLKNIAKGMCADIAYLVKEINKTNKTVAGIVCTLQEKLADVENGYNATLNGLGELQSTGLDLDRNVALLAYQIAKYAEVYELLPEEDKAGLPSFSGYNRKRGNDGKGS